MKEKIIEILRPYFDSTLPEQITENILSLIQSEIKSCFDDREEDIVSQITIDHLKAKLKEKELT